VDLDLAGVAALATLARRDDLGVALDELDLVLLHQELDALVELGGDVARAADGLGPSRSRFALDLEAPGFLLVELFHEFGVGEEGLGGDAAPVEADAAELVALDDGGLVAELSGADGADVAAGPPPMTTTSKCRSATVWSFV
jgi:hypothetical protein